METQSKAKDFFINLGAIVALYTGIVSLVNLLFTVINVAYPKVTESYSFMGSTSISWPVATLLIFFPIFLVLMWLLEKDYRTYPDKQNSGIHRWLTYITLFLAGIALAINLITVLYYFLDGQELTTGFLLKVLVLFIIAGAVFSYYLMDIMGKLTAKKRVMYRIIACAMVLISIIWGFTVLGSPQTQRLYKYDEQKVYDLQNIDGQIMSYYEFNKKLPESLEEILPDFGVQIVDTQTGKSYGYQKTGATTYKICADFNKPSPSSSPNNRPSMIYPYAGAGIYGAHPAGEFCYDRTINPNIYSKPVPVR